MRRKLNKTVIFYTVIFGILVARLTGILNINIVSGESMEPNFHDGEIVLTTILKDPERGSVVVAKNNNNRYVIKRLIGMPGDRIDIINDVLYLNGGMMEEKYIKDQKCISTKTVSYTLADDEYFIAGDNRCGSLDSRTYGPIKRSNLISTVIGTIIKK